MNGNDDLTFVLKNPYYKDTTKWVIIPQNTNLNNLAFIMELK